MTMNQQVADFCQRYFTDRRGSNCKKWDLSQELFGAPDLLGMWIADMEFKVPEAVQKVLPGILPSLYQVAARKSRR